MNARWKLLIITAAAVAGVATTVSLGRWQLSRAAQKEALQAAMDAQGMKAPLGNAALRASANPQNLVHQPARLTGSWIPRSTVFLDNRQMEAKVGFFAFTAFALEGGGPAIVVQRGWVQRNFEERASLPALDTPTGVVQIEGRIAPPPSKLYEPGQPAAGQIRQNLDLVHFSSETGVALMPVILQQTGAASEGLLRNWPAPNLGVDKHYGYALQWFGLAALIALLYCWFQIVRRFFPKSKDASAHV